MAIGNPLKLSPDFPPLHTVHATFTAHGVPSVLFVKAIKKGTLIQIRMPKKRDYEVLRFSDYLCNHHIQELVHSALVPHDKWFCCQFGMEHLLNNIQSA